MSKKKADLADRSRWLHFGLAPASLAGVLIALDQLTKYLIVRDQQLLYGRYVLIPNFLDIVHVRNKGAAWGILNEHTWLLTLISFAATGYVIWQYKALAEGCKLRGIAVSVLLGGIIGNLIDRAFRPDGVVDFVRVHYKETWEYPSFNVADSAVCVGVGLILLMALVSPANKDEKPVTE